MQTVRPASGEEAAAEIGEAAARGQRLRIVGGGTGSRRGPEPGADDLGMSTAALTEIVDHVPADLTITVGAGLPVAELEAHLADHGQEWPQHGALAGATVGGVLARAVSGPRRLGHGPVRDSVLGVALATGGGRLVHAGGRTVKNVSGYDIPRLVVGSWGALGVITEVTLKLWPAPARRCWFRATAPLSDRGEIATEVLAGGNASAVLWTPGEIWVEREGQPDDVVPPAGLAEGDAPPSPAGATTVTGGVAPAAVGAVAAWAEERELPYRALGGVGSFTLATPDLELTRAALTHAQSLGGHAEIVDASAAVRDAVDPPPPVGISIMKRMKAAFDPAGVLNPGVLGEGL